MALNTAYTLSRSRDDASSPGATAFESNVPQDVRNIFPGERYGRVKRVHNRYHGEINGYFLCDRGRFGIDFVNSTHRVRQAGLRVDDELFDAVAETQALEYFADALREGSTIGVGSARASLEDNMALMRLVGQENFSSGLSTQQQSCCSEALDVYRTSGGTIASLSDIEQADAIIVLADDVLHTAPRVALAIRQAVNQQAVALAQTRIDGTPPTLPGML